MELECREHGDVVQGPVEVVHGWTREALEFELDVLPPGRVPAEKVEDGLVGLFVEVYGQ